MDVNQLTIALIGASSTLLGAWLSSRSKLKANATPTKRSLRKNLLKLTFYFLLGGVATYWVMNWLLPFERIDERLKTLESHTQSLMPSGFGFVQVPDSIASPSLPVGSVILSVLPPDRFLQLRDASMHWVPADGRLLDSLSRYAALTGERHAPYMEAMFAGRNSSDSTAQRDSLHQLIMPVVQQSERSADHVGPTLYWYIRIN